MNLSMKWLNDFVKADMPIKEFVAQMTMSGSKVETYDELCAALKNVVVAKVVKMEKLLIYLELRLAMVIL